MNTLELAKFKQHLLQEIGGEEGSVKPYDFDKSYDKQEERSYTFETDSGLKYRVDLYTNDSSKYGPASVLYIEFGVEDENGYADTLAMTNKGELYRVMNTVAAIIKKDLASNKSIKYIIFAPSVRKGKDDSISNNARTKLYLKYITSRIPNAEEIENKGSEVLIKIR